MSKKVKNGRVDVAIVMGSDSDWEKIEPATDILKEFGITYEVRVISAHRTPVEAAEYASGAARRGLKVIIAAAGGAAHLGGVIASYTTLPVIGIPVSGGALPVNAAVLAARIIATGRPGLVSKLNRYRAGLKRKVFAGDRRVRQATSR